MKVITSLLAFALAASAQTVIGTAPTGAGPVGLIVAPNHKVYTANAQSNNATVYNPSTQASTAIALPGCNGPGVVGGIGVNQVLGLIFIPCEYSGTVSVINSSTDALITTLYAGGSSVLWVASDDAAGVLGIQNEWAGLIYFFDETTWSLLGTAATPNPEQIVVDQGTHTWYAANENNSEITIIAGPGVGAPPPPPPPPSCSGGMIKPSLNFTPSNYYPTSGSQFTLTLSVAGEICGAVTFMDAGVVINSTTVSSSGIAQFTYSIPSGSHQFTARFGGSNTKAAATSNTLWIHD